MPQSSSSRAAHTEAADVERASTAPQVEANILNDPLTLKKVQNLGPRFNERPARLTNSPKADPRYTISESTCAEVRELYSADTRLWRRLCVA